MGGEATDRAAKLLDWSEEALSLANWHKIAAQSVVEYLRLDQLSKSATYSKPPKGNSEGYYIQVLRQNETHLAMHGNLWNSKDEVIAAAENLLDADLDHAGLPWENAARAVSRWEQSLRIAFPLLMRAGGAVILARWHDKPITTRNTPSWAALPPRVVTVGGLLHHARDEGVIGSGGTATLADPAPALGGNQRFRTQAAMGGRNNLLNAFAIGIIGLIGEGVANAGDIAAKIPNLPPQTVGELVRLGQGNATPASLRVIQLLLANRLRALSHRLGVKPDEEDDGVRARALADHFGIAVATLVQTLDGLDLSLFPPEKDGDTETIPALGLHRNDRGLWSSVRTQAGKFDLTSDAPPGAPQAAAWSSSLPKEVQRHLRARMYGRTNLGDPVEGAFAQGGRDYAVWRTTGDNNCSFNGMALIVAGLVSQGQMTADDLAGRLGIPAERLRQAAEMARDARIDSRRGHGIEALLSGSLRAAAVAALGANLDILTQMQEEFFGELRGALLLHFAGRRLPRGDLFDDHPRIAAILAEATGKLVAILTPLCEGQAKGKRETLIDAVLAEVAGELRELFQKEVLTAYFAHMQTDGVWAGAPELQALARLMGVRLSIFRDWGGGIFGRDEGIAAAGSASSNALTDLDIEELRRQDLIEGRPMALGTRIHFRPVPMEVAEARLADHPDLLATFKTLRGEGYVDAPIEIGMFRHRTRAHWSAVSTIGGSYNLQDETDRIPGVPILAGPVDSVPSIFEPTAARTQPAFRTAPATDGKTADGKATGGKTATGMIEQEFRRGDSSHRVWRTTGDNNCSFNGMAQTIAGLVAQGRMTREHLLNSLGEQAPASLDAILENAKRARQSPQAARAVEKALADPLRQAAASALAGRGDLRAQMAEEFIDELRGHAYTALGVPWHRSGDLFERGNGAIRAHLKKTADGLAQALAKACAGKTSQQKEKLIDDAIDANLPACIDWFNDEGMAAYLAEMRRDGVWAGAPELQALAGQLGVSLSIFRDFGQGIVTRDEGMAGAGSADASGLSDAEVDQLRALEIIEGRPRGVASLIYFKRLPRERVVARLRMRPALRDTFLPLYDARYRFRDAAPIEVGMFRHRHPHWSAVTTGLNAHDLSDPTDRREAVSGEDGLETMQEEEPPANTLSMDRKQPGTTVQAPTLPFGPFDSRLHPSVNSELITSGHTGTVRFTRPSLAVPGVTTHYADHMFGKPGRPFSLNTLDPLLPPGKSVGLVNAANTSLLGGGGIDGAIHREEGNAFNSLRPNRAVSIEKWRKASGRKGIDPGEAIAAESGDLQARGVARILHTVGPRAGDGNFDAVLRDCVRSVLDRASEEALDIIIFANISAGIFGGDAHHTATVIQAEVERLLNNPPMHWGGWMPIRIVFNNFPKAELVPPSTGLLRKRSFWERDPDGPEDAEDVQEHIDKKRVPSEHAVESHGRLFNGSVDDQPGTGVSDWELEDPSSENEEDSQMEEENK